MKMRKRKSRSWITIAFAVLIIGALTWAFWPRPLMVDLGKVRHEAMIVTVNEEGKTRVRDAYVVSTPVAGRLLRIEVESGDQVEGGKSIIARMLPSSPSVLDVRTREQARTAVTAAEAAVRVAQADLNKAKADIDLANLNLKRKQTLKISGVVSQAAVEQAERSSRAAQASVDQAMAGISMRQADLANTRARLINFSDASIGQDSENVAQADAIPLLAPISGRILRILQRSETTLPAGKPVLEIGDISNDLEIVAELLSTDAVRVSIGNRVIVDNWGGANPLAGIVIRIDPWGFTKFSALGVEEQRVNVVIKFSDSPSLRKSLGHGFRVEARIVIWENANALVVPSSALFRDNLDWVVFVAEDGAAVLKKITIGRNNGIQAEILAGLEVDDTVVLFPGSGLVNGSRIAERQLN
jgi:HlyD family secretion protein